MKINNRKLFFDIVKYKVNIMFKDNFGLGMAAKILF